MVVLGCGWFACWGCRWFGCDFDGFTPIPWEIAFVQMVCLLGLQVVLFFLLEPCFVVAVHVVFAVLV